MDNLAGIPRNETYQILSRVARNRIEIHFKEQDSDRVVKTTLFKNAARKIFYVENNKVSFEKNNVVTFKIIIDRKLYFLKTTVRKGNAEYFFENFDHMFELVRRKKPRYIIPEHWAQTVRIQAVDAPVDLKSPGTILDMSRTGMRLFVRADLPRYQKNQTVNLFFKLYRRAEILVKSKIIYVQNGPDGGGPIVGLEFSDNSILIGNKIQNVCDDLAFYWTSELDVQHK
jgi:hypothetical protein